MTRIAITVFLSALFWPVTSLSQVESIRDSLENLLDEATQEKKVEIFCELSETYWQSSYDTSLLMAIHAHTLALKIENKLLIARSLNMTGNAYYLMGDFTKSMDHYLQALTIREDLGDSNSIASSYNNIGAVYLQMKDYQQALYYLKKAKTIFEALQDEVHLFSIMNNIGAVYVENEKFDTAY